MMKFPITIVGQIFVDLGLNDRAIINGLDRLTLNHQTLLVYHDRTILGYFQLRRANMRRRCHWMMMTSQGGRRVVCVRFARGQRGRRARSGCHFTRQCWIFTTCILQNYFVRFSISNKTKQKLGIK